MILATFPRQIQVIQYIAEIVNSLLRWRAVKERVSSLYRTIAVGMETGEMTGKINMQQISCSDATGNIVDLSNFKLPSAGRLTMRGGNGSGKSTLLLDIKRRYPEHSIILPAHNNLHFSSVAGEDLSTGQKLARIIDELFGIKNLRLLLLDEWDANLDAGNMRMIDAKIDRLAQFCCVIEVRHRKEVV